MALEVEFTHAGYLYLSDEIAGRYFPNNGVVALLRGREMWLMPTHNHSSGGFLLKQRNVRGDRAVFISEVLQRRDISGLRIAFWDGAMGALRVALEPSHV